MYLLKYFASLDIWLHDWSSRLTLILLCHLAWLVDFSDNSFFFFFFCQQMLRAGFGLFVLLTAFRNTSENLLTYHLQHPSLFRWGVYTEKWANHLYFIQMQILEEQRTAKELQARGAAVIPTPGCIPRTLSVISKENPPSQTCNVVFAVLLPLWANVGIALTYIK